MNLTIYGADGSRTTKVSYYFYLSDGLQSPFNIWGINTCQTTLYGSSDLSIYDTNVFYYTCTMDNVTTYLNNNFNFTWTVTGMSTSNYYTLNSMLYIRPYGMVDLTSGAATINIAFTPKTSRRMLATTSDAVPTSYSFMRTSLTMGTVTYTSSDGNQNGYTSQFTFSFSNFVMSTGAQIYF